MKINQCNIPCDHLDHLVNTRTRKAFNKVQHPVLIKNFLKINKLGSKLLQPDKGHQGKTYPYYHA
jgi:hypothetical protein